MKETRVENFKEYREQISKIPDSKKEVSEDIDSEITPNVESSSYSHPNQERLRQNDEYTIMVNNAMLAEKRAQEEKERKKALKKKILYSSLVIGLSLIALVIIIVLIVIISIK